MKNVLIDSDGSPIAEDVKKIVEALRRYRQACKETLGLRYRDGECDGVTLYNLGETINEIEDLESPANTSS